ncbi:DUF11 domain-containing protein [Planctomycetes bacterium CA13]
MNSTVARSERHIRRNLPTGRVSFIAFILLTVLSSGCGRLRLPAIDPSGSCLFSRCPTSTYFSLPGCNGEGCFSGLSGANGTPRVTTPIAPSPASGGFFRYYDCLGCLKPFCFCPSCLSNSVGTNKQGRSYFCIRCLTKPHCGAPKPAFPEPETPPKCSAPPSTIIGGAAASNEPCVPGPACGGSCQSGPPAVLFGTEIDEDDLASLPESGQRGCILLSPQKIVAPVGGEVILLSGICGTDGYLKIGETLEWMLTPDSVGTFIQVGDDDPGFLHKLTGIKKAEKHDPSYARGITSTKRTMITRGNLDRSDDVLLEKGQTWLSLSSPSEGTSRVTVLAPDSDCWDQRKATATIYWIDARWQFPSSQIVPKGVAVPLTTRVTRAEGTEPARGWKVRYEIQQPEFATFAGTGGSSVVEVVVDDSGDAPATVEPVPGTNGTTAIDIQVIRPGGDGDNMPTMTLGRGSTNVTWSSPQLTIRAGAPSVASFDVPYEVVANVQNPGDQPTTNVRVSVELPPGTRTVSADSFAQVLPNAVVWEIGSIPPQTQLDLSMNVVSQSPVQMTFQARGDGGLVSEDTVRVDVYRPSLTITSTPDKERYEAGQDVVFNIDVKNTGDRPMSNVQLKAFGDEGMLHKEKGTRDVGNDKTDGPLQPGQTWTTSVVYVPTRAGRRCVGFQAIADGGQQAQSQNCVTVINPVPPAPVLTVRLEGRERVQTGDSVLLRAFINNSGKVPLADTLVILSYDPQMQLLQATEGADQPRPGQYLLQWNIDNLDPGQTKVLEGQFRAVSTSPQSRAQLSARSRDGTAAQTDLTFAIVAGPPPVINPPTSSTPQLPPALPPPAIPGGPGITSPSDIPRNTPPSVTPPAATPPVSGQVRVEIFGRDNPVRVGEPIRYTLRVTNDSNQIDGEVRVRFNLPTGTSIDRIAQRQSPIAGQYQVNAGMVTLEDIRSMRPGETLEYDIVLRSNQPQTINLMVESISRRGAGGSDMATTEVIQ